MFRSLWIFCVLGCSLGRSLEESTTIATESETDTTCLNWDQEPGKCMRYYLCNDTVSQDGSIDIHLSYQPCPSYMDVCCKSPLDPKPAEDPIQPEGCGWSTPLGLDLSSSGGQRVTNFGEFPWVVAILKVDSDKIQYIGSGSLIDRSVVLTTAHFVTETGKFRVRAGEWDSLSDNELYPHQEREVQKIVVHKDFNKKTLFYDVALLFLEKPVDPAPNIRIACLPPPRETAEPDTRCFTTGWGKEKFGDTNRFQAILGKVELPVVARKDCRGRLRNTRLGGIFELHHTFMCAGGGKGSDGCGGDGGSALVCPMALQKGRFVQNGIVSWGIGCGEDGTPAVFVDVSNVRDWIDNEVLGTGVEQLEYTKY